MSKSYLIFISLLLGGFLLITGFFVAVYFYLKWDSDYRMSFLNETQETISRIEIVVGDDERYEANAVMPGEIAEIKLSPPQDRPFEIIVLFSSDKRLVLADPVYAPAGAQRLDAFIVREDGIVLSGGERELPDAIVQTQ